MTGIIQNAGSGLSTLMAQVNWLASLKKSLCRNVFTKGKLKGSRKIHILPSNAHQPFTIILYKAKQNNTIAPVSHIPKTVRSDSLVMCWWL